MALFLDLPCLYTYLLVFFLLIFLKIIMQKRISFVMTNLMMCSTKLTLSIGYISYQNLLEFIYVQSSTLCVFTFVPLFCFLFQILFNLWISVVHRIVLSYAGYRNSILVYIPSVILTYHCLS